MRRRRHLNRSRWAGSEQTRPGSCHLTRIICRRAGTVLRLVGRHRPLAVDAGVLAAGRRWTRRRIDGGSDVVSSVRIGNDRCDSAGPTQCTSGVIGGFSVTYAAVGCAVQLQLGQLSEHETKVRAACGVPDPCSSHLWCVWKRRRPVLQPHTHHKSVRTPAHERLAFATIC